MRNKTSWVATVILAAILAPGCKPATDVVPLGPPGSEWDDHTQGLTFVIGYDAGLARAQSEDKPAMMFVTTTWCGWCKVLAEENFRDPQVARLLESFVCVIVDGDEERRAQQKLGATQGYPHIIFITPDGQRLADCLGYKPVDEFRPIVETALRQAGIAAESSG